MDHFQCGNYSLVFWDGRRLKMLYYLYVERTMDYGIDMVYYVAYMNK